MDEGIQGGKKQVENSDSNSDKLYRLSNVSLMFQHSFGSILTMSTPALPFIGIGCPTAALFNMSPPC